MTAASSLPPMESHLEMLANITLRCL